VRAAAIGVSLCVMHPVFRSLPRRVVCILLLLAHAGACSQWNRLPGTAEDNVSVPMIHRARLVMHDGTEVIVRDAQIRPDSIIGKNLQTHERRAVPTANVAYVDSRRGWTERTVGGIAGLAVVGAISAAVVIFTVRVFSSAVPAPAP
jgi:hypothetical protein